MHVDTAFVSDAAPETEAERIAYCNDAISEANNWLARRCGITFTAYIEAGDIRVED